MSKSTTSSEGPNPSGLCMCGCGGTTPVSHRTDSRKQYVRGEHTRFCAYHHPPATPPPSPPIRSVRLTDVHVTDTGCWIWQGRVDRSGYGALKFRGRSMAAHRFYYEQLKGPIPEGLQIDHLCSVRLCVNPEHLEAVSGVENVRRSSVAKLSMAVALEIRMRAVAGEALESIARLYGVTASNVGCVVRGRTWREDSNARPPA